MNILFSKITKRKKIEFDDSRSTAAALVKSVLSIELLSTKVPAICVQTPIDKIVFAFKDESLCREWLNDLLDDSADFDDHYTKNITDLVGMRYSEFDAMIQAIEVSDSAEYRRNLEHVFSINVVHPDSSYADRGAITFRDGFEKKCVNAISSEE